MINNVKWLFFDLGSTLVDESLVYEKRLKKIAYDANVSYDSVYNAALDFYKQNKKGDSEVSKLFNVEKPKWTHMDERLYADTEKCLIILRKKYKIGIIANQSSGTINRLETMNILKYIDLVIASADEGVAKPDRKIFEIALARSGCDSSNAVMIGDRIDNDIVPAKLLGMKTIWIKQGFGQYWNITSEEEIADFVVGSLTELCDLLLGPYHSY